MISAITLTKNSEKTIKNTLTSLSFCEEVIVIDDDSKDGTKKIAQSLKATIYEKKLNNDFSESRNFGLSKAKYDWVLFIDSDETVSPQLQEEIKKAITAQEYDGYKIPRVDIFDSKILQHGETGNMKFLRLGKKSKGKWKRTVHETWDIEGKIGELSKPILHSPHPTVKEFLSEINTYSTLHAEELKKEGKKANVFTIVAYPTGKFIQNYIFKLGFLDGTAGFIVATMMSFHSFLSQGKLWQLNQPKEV